MSSAAAAARITDLIGRGKSEHVQLRPSEYVLGVSRIAPANQPQVSINLELKAGYVIDLSEPDESDRSGSILVVYIASVPINVQTLHKRVVHYLDARNGAALD